MTSVNINDSGIDVTALLNIEAVEDSKKQCFKPKPKRKTKADELSLSEKKELNKKMQQEMKEELIRGIDVEEKKTKKASTKEPDNESDNSTERQKHIMMLRQYAESERFKKYLKDMGFKLEISHIRKLNLIRLKDLLERVRFALSNRQTNDMINDMVKKGLLTAEIRLSQISKLKLQGLTNTLFSDESFLDDLELIRLQYLNFGNIDPRLRITLTVLKTTLAVHTINSHFEDRQTNTPVSDVN